jgi:lipopolysaccharide assembly outer membrane protein LptD (OstA)
LKSLLISGLTFVALACPLRCQPTTEEPVQMTAAKITRDGSVLHGTGSVKAKVGSIMFQAETGVLNRETGEVALSGHVHLVLPPRSDHNLFRYDGTALVTEHAVDVFADQMTVKNGNLKGSGHVRILADKAQLMADEIRMFLGNADARLTGNIQAVGVRAQRQTLIFPPEIILK